MDLNQLKELRQWIVQMNKVPFQANVEQQLAASTTDPSTWSTYDDAMGTVLLGDYDGIGFVFKKGGGIVGIDLDGCRNPETGEIASWAQEIIDRFNSYAEISPSGTGVHILVQGNLTVNTSGFKRYIDQPEIVPGKRPAIEIYQHSRYFTFTGKEIN